MTSFDAEKVALGLHERLWRYLTSSADELGPLPAIQGLFDLSDDELSRLTAAHVTLSAETRAMLSAMPALLRQLPSSIVRSSVEARGRIEPPIDWARTRRRQLVTADRSLFVGRPVARAYDTALGRLALLALNLCVEAADDCGLADGQGAAGDRVRVARATAAHLREHQKLRGVTRVARVPERTLTSLARLRGASPVIDYVRLATQALRDLDTATIEQVVRQRLLSPSKPDRLFELFVGFALVDWFRDHGWVELPVGLLPQRGVPLARLKEETGSEQLALWWQRPIWTVLEEPASTGAFREVLKSAEMTASTLRPDFILEWRQRSEALLVEVKLTQREEHSPDRDGIRDVLAYLKDAGDALAARPLPHAMVAAWNATGKPNMAEVLVCDQSHVGAAAAVVATHWGLAHDP